jgi:hypothetical protein
MKKKPIGEPIVSPQIMEMAKKSIELEKAVPPSKPCAVCGAPATPVSGVVQPEDEDLCWVCRRLKISAWRDSDQQIAAQE